MTGHEEADPAFEGLLEYMKSIRGFDFTGYKRSSVRRRVQKRMEAVNTAHFADYRDYLEVHNEEFIPLFNTILINITSFFRDPEAWKFLASHPLPEVIAAKEPDKPIRVWSAGCASGEEPYSIAMLLAEALGLERFRQQVKIYATDIDERSLDQARQACYSEKALEAVPEEVRRKYFIANGQGFVVHGDLRRAVIFGRHDLLQDAPISHLDLLLCRNTLMYFNADTQSRILSRFHFAVRESGYLFLGRAEMLLTHGQLFTPVELKHRIFRTVAGNLVRDRLSQLVSTANHVMNQERTGDLRLSDAALDAVPVAYLVVDAHGCLVSFNAGAKTLLGLVVQDRGKLVQDLEVSYRPLAELRSLIEQACQEGRPLRRNDVERQLPHGEFQYLDVVVTPLFDERRLIGVGISFTVVTERHRLEEELQRSKENMETAYEELQSSNEELETTNEELQSSNEELETTNEELQSANEEMETMNEELHSTNEELQSTNDQLRQRSTEADGANLFLHSVLGSLQTGVTVVDRELQVSIWNSHAEDLWGLRSDEVEGKSFMGLECGLPVGQLAEAIRTCLSVQQTGQEVLLKATNRRGRSFTCRVTINPLQGEKGGCSGAILLMEDWDEARISHASEL